MKSINNYWVRRYFTQGYKPSETYFIEDLKKECDSVCDKLEEINEVIETLEAYKMELMQRAGEVLALEYTYQVEVHRNAWNYDKKVYYEAIVTKVVKDAARGEREKHKQIEFKRFAGKERKQALEQAQEWAKEYNVKEILKNF